MKKYSDAEVLNEAYNARVALISKQAFFGTLAMELDIRLDESIPTAAVTDRGDLLINPNWFMSLTVAQRLGLICHEVLHPALLLFQRLGGRDLTMSNIAHDYIVNWMVKECGMEIPPDGLYNSVLGQLTYEEVYDLLKKEADNRGLCSDCLGDSNHCKNAMPPTNPDNRPRRSRKEQAAQEEMDKLQNGQWGVGPDLVISDGSDPNDHRTINKWRQAVAGAKLKAEKSDGWGNLPLGLRQMVDDILEAKVNWQEKLSRWMGDKGRRDNWTYRRSSRRQGVDGIIHPALEGSISDTAIIIDTSGSMTGEPLKEVISEVAEIVEDLHCAATVLSCDTEVHSTLEGPEDIQAVLEALEGGGGSDLRPAFALLEEQQWRGPVLAATDGFIDVPSECPQGMEVMWLINSGGRAPADWGESIYLEAQ